MNQSNTSMIPDSLDDYKTPIRYTSAPMPDNEIPRSLRFPQSLWDAIDRDAVLHKRSAVKHLEFLLTAYYRGEAPQLNFRRMLELQGEATFHTAGEELVPVREKGTIGKKKDADKDPSKQRQAGARGGKK